MNLTVQIFIGIPLEMAHGWWRVVLIYIGGVIAGSLATSIADPYILLAGASGGVYSLITAHIASIVMVGECLLVFKCYIIFLLRIGKKCRFLAYN